MKLLLKNTKATKLYAKQITYQQISKFITQQFPDSRNWTLSFTDFQGDNIIISSQSDIQIMKQMLQGKKFIKLNLYFEGDQAINTLQSSPRKQKKSQERLKVSKEKKEKKSQEKLVSKEKKDKPANTKTESANNEQGLKKDLKQWKKMGRGYLRQSFKKNGITSESDFSKSKQKTGPWARGGEMVQKRRTNRLSKLFGGDPESYLQFVLKTLQLQLQDVIATYAKQNNINLEQKVKGNFQRKLEKLSFFFNKSAEQYKEIVKANPQLHFRAIIKILKQKGLEDYNGHNFDQMRQKLQQAKDKRKAIQRDLRKQQKAERKNEGQEIEEKNIDGNNQEKNKKTRIQVEEKNSRKDKEQNCNKNRKTQKGNASIEKVELKLEDTATQQKHPDNKAMEMRQKGKILIEMKELFGSSRAKNYFKFIESNFLIGRDAIIEKWIELQESMSQ